MTGNILFVGTPFTPTAIRTLLFGYQYDTACRVPMSAPHNKVKSLDELCSFLSSKWWMDKVSGRVPETSKN
jgi:hypothetical protein